VKDTSCNIYGILSDLEIVYCIFELMWTVILKIVILFMGFVFIVDCNFNGF
jgi:hypothetical protein